MTGPSEEPSSLLDWATSLATDPALRTRLAQEPRAVLDEQGLTDLPPADLHHSLPLVSDSVAARLGSEVDATTASSGAPRRPGEGPVIALARHLVRAAAVAALVDDAARDPEPEPEPEPEPDDIDPTTDHVTPQETITMTTSASAAAAHGFNESDWARIEARAETFGYGNDVDRFLAVANQSDDRFTALFGDGLGDRYWQDHRGPMEGSTSAHSQPGPHGSTSQTAVPTDDQLGGDTDLDGFGEPEAGGPAADVRTPGTPQGQHELELEAQSHGYPTAEAYVSDTALTGGLRDSGLAWEPGNGSAAYGQLQNYMDAAAAGGVSVSEYAASHHFTPDQIDAAYADPTGSGAGPADPDLGGIGTPAPAGADPYVPHGDDPFGDMLQATGQGTGLPTTHGGDTDLDDFGSSAPAAPVSGDGSSPGIGGDTDLDGFGEPEAGGPAADIRTPGTPQGQHELELEAQSHGYPTAEAYVSDTALTGGLRDSGLAWEPGNGSAAYGQLQNYMDAAAAGGVSVSDYAASHHFTPDQIDAAYADPTGSGAGPADPDLGGIGEPPAGADPYVPHGDDPFGDMLQATGQGTGLPTTPGGDTDLDDFGSGPGHAGDHSFGASPGGGESFGAGDVAATGGVGDVGPATGPGSSGEFDGSGGSDHSGDTGFGDAPGAGHTDFSDHSDVSDHSSGYDDGGSHDGGSHDGSSHDGGSHDAGGDGGSHDTGGDDGGAPDHGESFG